MTHILFADDNPEARDLVTLIFSTRYTGVAVSALEDGVAVMNLMHTAPHPPDLILLDYQMPPAGNGGLWAAKQIAAGWPGLPLFFLSAYSLPHIKAELAASGVWGYLKKESVIHRAVSDALVRADWVGLRRQPADVLLFDENIRPAPVRGA